MFSKNEWHRRAVFVSMTFEVMSAGNCNDDERLSGFARSREVCET